jgi:hypothetical protein
MSPGRVPIRTAIECVPTCVPRAKGREIGRDIGTAGTILDHDLGTLISKASSTAP